MISRFRAWIDRRARHRRLAAYYAGGRRPWSEGYLEYREDFLRQVLANDSLLQPFRTGGALPHGYGEFLDERVVELPWLLARLGSGPRRLLDAGSALNHSYVLDHPALRAARLSIVTLAPEPECHWRRGVNYLFEDLRALPFRESVFDEAICLSTLEHVGMDNRLYTGAAQAEAADEEAYLRAAAEIRRVTRAACPLYFTMPYGKPIDYGWYRQFDAPRLARLLEVLNPTLIDASYFRYADGGWQRADEAGCAGAVGFDIHQTRYCDPASTRDYDPDFAAASRAVVALEIR